MPACYRGPPNMRGRSILSCPALCRGRFRVFQAVRITVHRSDARLNELIRHLPAARSRPTRSARFGVLRGPVGFCYVRHISASPQARHERFLSGITLQRGCDGEPAEAGGLARWGPRDRRREKQKASLRPTKLPQAVLYRGWRIALEDDCWSTTLCLSIAPGPQDANRRGLVCAVRYDHHERPCRNPGHGYVRASMCPLGSAEALDRLTPRQIGRKS